MTREKYLLGFIAVLLAAIGLCSFIASAPRDFVYSGKNVYTVELIRASENLIAGIDRDAYAEALANMYSENDRLERYHKLLGRKQRGAVSLPDEDEELLAAYDMSESEASFRLQQLLYCEKRLEYALSYEDYIEKISRSVQDMSALSIFGESIKKNMVRTEADFYGHKNIPVDAQPDEGIKLLLSGTYADVIALFAAALCAVLCGLYCRAGAFSAPSRKSGFIPLTAVFAVGTALLYSLNIFFSDRSLSLGDLSRPVQSVTDNMSCPYIMSVGTLLLIKAAFSTAACLTVYLLFVGVISCRRRLLAAVIAAALLAADALFCAAGSPVGLFAALRAENVFGKYGNIIIFGESFRISALLIVFTLSALAVSAVFAFKAVSAASVRAKEQSEQAYFDEINERYTEARLIRHDISNHLAAVAMLMDEGDIEGARRYLGDISAQLDEIRPPVKTGSAVLDALLFRKVTAARDKGIPVALEFRTGFRSCGITDYDLCGVFSNLLDNATEACEKLPREERGVTLKVSCQLDMICIFCENRYAELRRENGGFSTTKQDNSFHGFGLRRIERIAAKYKGSVDISAENGVFAISVLLNRLEKNVD